MSIPLPVLKVLGPAIAKHVLAAFNIPSTLTNLVLEQAIDTSIEGLLNRSETKATLSQTLDPIARQVEADLQQLFEQEARNLSDNSRNAILLAVAETLVRARLTPATLAEQNFNPETLKQTLLQTNPKADRDFSQDETALYHQALARASQHLIDATPQLAGFDLNVATITLKRLEEISTQLQTQRQQAIQAEDKFAVKYRHTIRDELDCLEVFGLPRMDRLTRQQSLSMAYITLSVTGEVAASEDDGPLALNWLGGEPWKVDPLQREARRISRQVHEAIRNRRRLVIRGGAGAGKSTLLQWLAVRAATQSFPPELQSWNAKIPFFIRLRSLVGRPFPAPEQFPTLVARNFTATMPADWVHRCLERGQALVLIDGVDELPRSERQDFFAALQDLVRDFSEATYVVTSRPYGLKTAQGDTWQDWEDWVQAQDFVNLSLDPMTAANVEEFINRWHAALPADDPSHRQTAPPAKMAENLQRQLRQRPELRRLASTPLLCAMICALHRERLETLPTARLQLYKECIDMLLNRRDAGRKIQLDDTYPTGLTEDQKLELLQSLALKLMRLNRSALEVARVDDCFAAELKKTSLPETVTGEQIRRLFADRAGLLREAIVGQIDFAHRTFQEYLAAKAALDDDSLEELLQRATDDQWREAIIVAAGLARPKERVTLLEELIQQGNNNPKNKHYLHFLAVACLETATTVEKATRDRVLTCARDLLPPQNEEEVALVARAGQEIVPLLQYESCYSVKEASKCIEALVQHIGKIAESLDR